MANRLRDYTLSDPIFVDANILVYHQVAHPAFGPDSRDFLERVEHGDIQAVTTNVVVNEVTYILQLQRAANLLGTSNRGFLHTEVATDGNLRALTGMTSSRGTDLESAVPFAGRLFELDEAVRYYDHEMPGLGFRFFQEVEAAVERIRLFPEGWTKVGKQTRRCLVKGFPYALLHIVAADEILVEAVAHLHRDPKHFRNRVH